MNDERKISAGLCIQSFFHCAKCLKEIPEGQSPQDYRRYDVGWTIQGFQVWCNRHQCNVIHMDFEGQKHPATTAIQGMENVLTFPKADEPGG